jgi:hypothetical protein
MSPDNYKESKKVASGRELLRIFHIMEEGTSFTVGLTHK